MTTPPLTTQLSLPTGLFSMSHVEDSVETLHDVKAHITLLRHQSFALRLVALFERYPELQELHFETGNSFFNTTEHFRLYENQTPSPQLSYDVKSLLFFLNYDEQVHFELRHFTPSPDPKCLLPHVMNQVLGAKQFEQWLIARTLWEKETLKASTSLEPSSAEKLRISPKPHAL